MKLRDVISKDAILPDLKSDERDGAMVELLDALIEAGRLEEEHREEVLLSLLKREAVATTALGNGVAIPHSKVKQLDNFCGALAISRRGIDFGASDGGAVHVVFLFLSPEHAISGHLQLMAHIAGIARHREFVNLLRQAKTVREIEDLIADAESMLFRPPDQAF
jgi:mannitol/fructose-specific phosphotransferase system IIA component (Ntr-type)